MDWLKSKTTAIAGGCLALIGLQGYGLVSMRTALDDRVGSAERDFQSARSQDETKSIAVRVNGQSIRAGQ